MVMKKRMDINGQSGHRRSSSFDTRTQDELFNSPTRKKNKPIPHNSDPTMPLYEIDQVPEYLRDNQYIKGSYRAYYTTERCISSVCRLHNETFNIWTHLLGGVIFILLVYNLFTTILVPEYTTGNVMVNKEDGSGKTRIQGEHTKLPLLIFGFYSFGCVGCMICSACFHTFLAHMSERLYMFAHALDYFGITILIVGSFLPFCYYVFSCKPFWRNTYIIMICMFGVVGMLGPFFRRWTSEAFATTKIVFYVCMVGSGLFPTLHMAFFLPDDLNAPYVKGLLAMLFLYGFGVFIYAFKIPEIFAPGRFDIYFSSHQIWHMFVLAAALTHFFNCVDMYVNYDKVVCVCV